MKLNKVLIVLFVGLFCMPAISLERRVSYDNGRWAEIPMNEKRGVVITDNPDDGMLYTGGIVSPGRKLYADLPDDRTHKYLKVKYSPVKPRPLVDTLKTNAEIKAVADEIKTDMKDAKIINQSETRRKVWKAYLDNMGVPKDVDWYGYNYMPETYEEIFIPNIVGLIGVGLWVFLVLLNLVRKRNKHTRNAKQKGKKMKKEQIPENPIDRFFYKIGRGTKNTGKTIAESEVVGKTVGFLFRNPWGLFIALFLMVLAVCGVFTLLGFE